MRFRSLFWCVASLSLVTVPALRGQGGTEQLPARIDTLAFARALGDADEFGRVSAAAVGPDDGFVAVLDAFNSRLAVFRGRGTDPVHYGRRGRGPGEFFQPLGIAVRGTEVLVLDGGNLQIIRIDASRPDLPYLGSIRVPFGNPAAICVAEGRIYVLGLRDGTVIHELDDDGMIRGSFGDVLPEDPTGGELSATGRLACGSHGLVAHVVSTLNHVAVYDLAGTNRWEGRIPGFVRQQYDTNGGVMRPLPPEGGFIHRVEAVAWIGGRLLIQFTESRRQATPMRQSRLLDIGEGWMSPSPIWPRVLTLTQTGALFYEEAPFPLVKVYDATTR